MDADDIGIAAFARQSTNRIHGKFKGHVFDFGIDSLVQADQADHVHGWSTSSAHPKIAKVQTTAIAPTVAMLGVNEHAGKSRVVLLQIEIFDSDARGRLKRD